MNEDLLFDVKEDPEKSPPLSPRTVANRQNVVRESLEWGRLEFPQGCNLDYLSHYMNHQVNWTK